jgi:hypothetical protein
MVPQSDKEIGDVRMTPARLGRREQTELWMEVVELQVTAGEIQVVEDKSRLQEKAEKVGRHALSESSDAIKDPEAERFFSPAIRERSQRNSHFAGKEQPSTFHIYHNQHIHIHLPNTHNGHNKTPSR